MSIVRSKVSQNFTIVNNSVINDKEFDSKYLGTFLRLISKGENWEISASGMASLYPVNGIDFYRNAFKHMCKLGYLIRIPQPKIKGQYQKVLMELYDHRQIESNLSDEDVDKLFGKEELSTEEIQKIYPKRVLQDGQVAKVNHTQQRTEETSSTKIKEYNKQEPPIIPNPAEAAVVFSCLMEKNISQKEKEWLSRTYSEEIVNHAVAFTEDPQTKISTSYIQTLKWACKTRPELPIAFDEDSNREKAKSSLDHLQKIDENWEIQVLNQYVEFTPFVDKRADPITGRFYGFEKGIAVYFSYEKKSFWNDLLEFVKYKIPKLYQEICN